MNEQLNYTESQASCAELDSKLASLDSQDVIKSFAASYGPCEAGVDSSVSYRIGLVSEHGVKTWSSHKQYDDDIHDKLFADLKGFDSTQTCQNGYLMSVSLSAHDCSAKRPFICRKNTQFDLTTVKPATSATETTAAAATAALSCSPACVAVWVVSVMVAALVAVGYWAVKKRRRRRGSGLKLEVVNEIYNLEPPLTAEAAGAGAATAGDDDGYEVMQMGGGVDDGDVNVAYVSDSVTVGDVEAIPVYAQVDKNRSNGEVAPAVAAEAVVEAGEGSTRHLYAVVQKKDKK